MRRIVVAVGCALALGLTGCSVGASEPLSRITPGLIGTASPTVPTVAEPWRPGLRQLGVAVYYSHSTNDPDSTVRAKAERTMDFVVGLGANSVAISFPFSMDGPYASAVHAADHTPPPARLAILLDVAKQRHLRTTIRPLLAEENLARDDPDMWRGAIRPGNRAAWFASYRDLLLGYAVQAEQSDVDTFVLGTELTSLESDPGWATLATAVGEVYHGELGYSANHDRLRGPAPAPGLLKSIDAYPPLRVGDGASVDQLVAGWTSWLDAAADPTSLVLAEVAISARTGAYAEPWSPAERGPIIPEIQQRWFEAACRVMHALDLAGGYFWMINIDVDPATADPPVSQPMDFVGRPAQRSVADCFARGAVRTPAGT